MFAFDHLTLSQIPVDQSRIPNLWLRRLKHPSPCVFDLPLRFKPAKDQ